ncbi:hypothetical protein BT93_H0289 [Corymbia citriodora subsp. variegata]|nr:hypothetical protein BT93_H0289 [Corymbia citriodora subsp. variegata]
MWENLVAQAMYKIAILLTLQFKGESIFGENEPVKWTLIVNAFILCQVFNGFNARKLKKKNVFEGIHKNKLFLDNGPSGGDGQVPEVVHRHGAVELGTMEHLHWNRGCVLAYWLGCKMLSGPRHTDLQPFSRSSRGILCRSGL